MVFGAKSRELENVSFKFGDTQITPTPTHKHLGVILSMDGKWSSHVDYIIEKVTKQISVLRKLKYNLNRDTLSKIYASFIRPHFEYACEVWDGLSKFDIDRLEKTQKEALRIISGLPVFCSTDALYFETGFQTLQARRTNRKLCMVYKIQNNLAPVYLNNLMPPMVSEMTQYPLRNANNISIPRCRLNIYKNSFFPSSITAWNTLPDEIKNIDQFNKFKVSINPRISPPSNYLSYGKRSLNIIHTQLRHKCSKLNDDLYRVNLSSVRNCMCGNRHENAEHFFLQCPLYHNIRSDLNNVFMRFHIQPNINDILYGNPNLTNEQNLNLAKSAK